MLEIDFYFYQYVFSALLRTTFKEKMAVKRSSEVSRSIKNLARNIHKYSGFLVVLISVGLASVNLIIVTRFAKTWHVTRTRK